MKTVRYPEGRFLFVAMEQWEANGGFSDILFGFDNLEDFESSYESDREYDKFQVVDTDRRVFHVLNSRETLLDDITCILIDAGVIEQPK